MIGSEWDPLLNHRVTVRSLVDKDNYGNDAYEPIENARTYMCLVDTQVSVNKSSTGELHTVALTAYVKAIPLGSTVPVDIMASDEFNVIEPGTYGIRPINSIARHFGYDGSLHNLEITLS